MLEEVEHAIAPLAPRLRRIKDEIEELSRLATVPNGLGYPGLVAGPLFHLA